MCLLMCVCVCVCVCYTDSTENVYHNDKFVKHVWVCNRWMMCQFEECVRGLNALT